MKNSKNSLCYNSTNNGFSDWYLPSKDELNEIYIHRNILGIPSNFVRWSSSEHPGVTNHVVGSTI